RPRDPCHCLHRVHHLLLVHTIKDLHSSGQMLATGSARRKNGVRRTITFVLALADDYQVVQQFREPDLSRSDLFADVLLDLKSLVFGDKVMTPGAQQLLELERRRGEFTRLFAPYRYFSPVATEAG
ncbi:MAG: hypothetical protein Q7U99_20565, partial [Rubrivivax sp.]|nr:hypothetical protein [Rubrivivax sp.]